MGVESIHSVHCIALLANYHPTITAALYEPIRATDISYISVGFIILILLQEARSRMGKDQPARSKRTIANWKIVLVFINFNIILCI